MSSNTRDWSHEHERVRQDTHFAIETSPAMTEVFWQMTRVRWESNILLTGQTGTGKSQAARVINGLMKKGRSNLGAHVEANVASLPKEIIASELFGHTRGSFTGAQADRIGRFQQANGGTLMLDEVGEVPPATQVLLLSAFDAPRIIQRVGSNDQVPVELVAMVGTTRNLPEMVQDGEFDGPLYQRLRQKIIHMPSLHERGPEYIHHLVPALLQKLANGTRNVLEAEEAVITRIQGMVFPGNIRELNYLLKDMCEDAYQSGDKILTERHLDDALAARGASDEAEEEGGVVVAGSLREIEEQVILDTLDRCGGHRTNAATLLKISLRTLQRKLKRMGVAHKDRARYRIEPAMDSTTLPHTTTNESVSPTPGNGEAGQTAGRIFVEPVTQRDAS